MTGLFSPFLIGRFLIDRTKTDYEMRNGKKTMDNIAPKGLRYPLDFVTLESKNYSDVKSGVSSEYLHVIRFWYSPHASRLLTLRKNGF